MTQGYISLVAHVSQDFKTSLTIMQGDEPPIHIMYEAIGILLSSLVCKFIKKAHSCKSSCETCELKPIIELVKFDVSKKELLKSKIDIVMKSETLFHSTLLSNGAKEVTF